MAIQTQRHLDWEGQGCRPRQYQSFRGAVSAVCVCSSVRTLRVVESRNESLPSPLESFIPIVSKGFTNDWQIRICQLSKCLVDFRGRLFDFWGGYGWFQKKKSCRLISRGKKHAKKFLQKLYPALKKILLMTYNAEKILHRIYEVEKNF